MLTEKQQEFVILEKKFMIYKGFLDYLALALDRVAEEIGIDSYFQDPEDGTVYKVVKPKGRFVAYKDIWYERTRRAYLGETKGLSMKEVEAAGFELGDNQKKVIPMDEGLED